MKLCHDQPHLVPPMKLVFYDDLPGPSASRSSSISHWVSEGRTLASRATDRISTRRKINKRFSHTPTISNPSDFRRLRPPVSRLEPFRPLELSIYQPGNRLSDLPEFDLFDIDNFNKFNPLRPKPPAKVFSPEDSSAIHGPSVSSFEVRRKPVGSISRRALSVSDRIEVHDHRLQPQPPRPSLDPAPRNSVDKIKIRSNTHAAHTRTMSNPQNRDNSPVIDHQKEPHVISSSKDIYDFSFPSPPSNTTRMASETGFIPLNDQPIKVVDLKSSRSNKVTQWLFPKPPSFTPDPTLQAASTQWTSRPQHPNHPTIHSHTISGSTTSSSANNSSMTACSGKTSSLSSAITTTTGHPPPSISESVDKELESTGTETAFNMPHGNKMFASRLEEPFDTVYEAEPLPCSSTLLT